MSVESATIPMRANIVGPPLSATRIRVSMAACHSGAPCSFEVSDLLTGIGQRNQLACACLYRVVERPPVSRLSSRLLIPIGAAGPAEENGILSRR